MRLSRERYIEALKRMREVVNTEPLSYYDCTDHGEKDSSCNWGLCSKNYPPEDYNLSAPKFMDHGDHCPLDKDQGKTAPDGCFHRCRIFQDGLKDKEKVLELYDIKMSTL